VLLVAKLIEACISFPARKVQDKELWNSGINGGVLGIALKCSLLFPNFWTTSSRHMRGLPNDGPRRFSSKEEVDRSAFPLGATKARRRRDVFESCT